MSNLSYRTDHLAWTQRVAKESTDSTRFRKWATGVTTSSFSDKLSTSQSTSRLFVSNPNELRDEACHYQPLKFRAVPIVREQISGKKLSDSQRFQVSSRQFQRSSDVNVIVPKVAPEEKEQPRKSLSRPPSQGPEAQPVLSLRLPQVDKCIQARPGTQMSTRSSVRSGSKPAPPVEEQPIPQQAESRPRTSQSLKSTTSSQRRYIEDLERLLEEERQKRIQAEELLKSILTKG